MLKKYTTSIFLGVLLILGVIIRLEGIFSNHVLFIYDSARDFLYTRNIVENHRLYLIGPSSGGLQGYFHGVLWYYLLSIPFFLSHGNPISGTIFMIASSLTSVILTFFLMRKISNSYVAILASTFFAVTTFSVSTSRFTWNPYPIVWLMPLYFYFVYQYFNKKQVFIWLALVSGLFLHFEAVYGVPMLVPLAILAIIEISRKNIKQLLIGLSLLFLPMMPSLVFDLRHHFLISGSIAKAFITGGSNITHNVKAIPMRTRLVLRFQDIFTYTIGSLSTNIIVGILLTITAIFSLKNQKKSFLFFSLAVLFIPFLIFILMKYQVWSYYWIGETPYFVLLISLLIGTLPKKTFAIIAIALVFIFSGYFADLKKHKNGFSSDGSQTLSTEIKITDLIYKDTNNNPFSLYVLTPPVYDYVYRYIVWWRANTIYHYYPQENKQRLAYLIIDPSPTDPDGKYFINHVLHMQTKPVKSWNISGVQIKKFITKMNEQPVDENIFPPDN